jgi:hypothetical protein
VFRSDGSVVPSLAAVCSLCPVRRPDLSRGTPFGGWPGLVAVVAGHPSRKWQGQALTYAAARWVTASGTGSAK